MPIFKRPHFEKLLTLASQGRIAPVYLILGDLTVTKGLLRRLSDHFRRLGHDVQTLDLSSQKSSNLRSLFGGPSLLGRKVFILEGFEDSLADFKEDFINFLELAKAWLTILIVLEKLKENHPLYLYALEKGVVIPLHSKRERDLLNYEIPAILAAFGKKMERKAGEMLVAMVGEDLCALEQELAKLALYVGERSIITEDDIRQVVSPRPESAPYTIFEAYLREGPEGALRIIEELLSQGIHPLVILSTLVTYFKRLYLLAEIIENIPDLGQLKKYFLFRERLKEAFKELFPENPPKVLARLHPYAIFKMIPLAKAYSKEKFAQIFSALFTLDSKLKRGGLPIEEFYAFLVFLKRLEAIPDRKAGQGFRATSSQVL